MHLLFVQPISSIYASMFFKGILQGVYWGLGTGGGTIVGGYVVHVFGFRSTFRGFAVVTGVVLAVFLTTQLISKYSNLPQDDGNEEVEDDDNDEMFVRSRKSDNEDSVDNVDTIAEDGWKDHWQTPPAPDSAPDSSPASDSAPAPESGTKPEKPANFNQPAETAQPDYSADLAESTVSIADFESNTEEQDLSKRSEDTTKLIDGN